MNFVQRVKKENVTTVLKAVVFSELCSDHLEREYVEANLKLLSKQVNYPLTEVRITLHPSVGNRNEKFDFSLMVRLAVKACQIIQSIHDAGCTIMV
jgi:hypothetical protein